jgi:hypothetical protein
LTLRDVLGTLCPLKKGGAVNRTSFACLLLLLAAAPAAAQKCPSLDVALLNKGFADAGPWRTMSGGPAECSFRGKTTSINLGFSHVVARTPDAATAAASEMRQAVAPTSVVEPIPALGEHGIAYQPKDKGQVDRTSMFFYGHRGTVGVSGYLNLKDPITPAQRDLAANLIAATLGIASNPKALARATNCKYLDPALVQRLLPPGDVQTIVPDANSCIASAGGSVITVAISKDARPWANAERMLRNEKCEVDPIAGLGKGAGIAHHCGSGNPRAEVLVTTGSRWLRVLYAPAKEPTAEERAALVELAKAGASK